jgi:large repetitive protein
MPEDPLVTYPPRTEPLTPEEPQPEEPPVAETPTPTEPLPQDPLVTHPPRTEPPAPEEPQPEEPPSIGSSGNPGNGKSVGNAGESPNGSDFGAGSHGRSDAENDVPQSVLVSTEYADANEHHVDTFSLVQAEARDSARLGGATVILSDAQPGDMFVLDGYALHIENGRTMIGDTGIELVGGYAAEMGALTLSGNAPPETYAAVLGSLVLESCDASGPATGSKSIRVTLLDSEGVASMQKSVDIVLEDVQSAQAESSSGADALSQTSRIDLDASYLVLISDSDANGNSSASGSWIEQIESGGSSGSTVNTIVDLNHPLAEHVQSLDDLNVDLGRVHWSCQ